MGWALSRQPLINKNDLTGFPADHSDGGNSSTEISFPQVTVVCIKLMKTNQHSEEGKLSVQCAPSPVVSCWHAGQTMQSRVDLAPVGQWETLGMR